jgi:ADP-heptose:LPS heptosyltransferase/predicted SAM-dependent methyltransferase
VTWRLDAPQGRESAKIRWELPRYTRGVGLDIGCGAEKAYPHMIGVDNGHHLREFGIPCAADLYVQTCEHLAIIASASQDFVFSSHTLEHIADYKAALKEWWRVIKQGGHLVLYLPDEDEYPKVGEEGANPDHKWNVNYDRVVDAISEIGAFDLVRFEKRNAGDEYSLFFVFQKIQGREYRYSHKLPKPKKTCGIARYGAVGDMLMMSSILPWLKEQGYHITLYCSPYGYEAIQYDPHIDDIYMQDHDQVPNHVLGLFLQNETKKYDKWISLSGSIEDYLLPDKQKAPFYWPESMRRQAMNQTYLDVTHAIAEVPLPPRPKFYPTLEEKTWARTTRARIKGSAVLWSLSGSSVHKTWPHMDAIIARFMLETDATVIMVGARGEKILETGWENESRVWKRSGEWSIRQSLSFAELSDLVIGPETGLLNAVGCADVPKVVMLSHSTPNNLTKYWKNASVLTPPPVVACYPCHRLHKSFEFCHRDDDTGAALCQAKIDIETVWEAALARLGTLRRIAA